MRSTLGHCHSQAEAASTQQQRCAWAGLPRRRQQARRLPPPCGAEPAAAAAAAAVGGLASNAVPASAAVASLPRSLRERDYGALDKSQFGLFVQFFRQASPYIEGHRGRTFVLAIPGEVRQGATRRGAGARLSCRGGVGSVAVLQRKVGYVFAASNLMQSAGHEQRCPDEQPCMSSVARCHDAGCWSRVPVVPGLATLSAPLLL